MPISPQTHVTLPADSNQALGIAQYAIDFMSDEPGKRGEPDASVLDKTNHFHTDAVLCGVSAIALGTNAPVLLGLTQPQLWALTSVLGGAGMLVWSIRRDRRIAQLAATAPQAPQTAAPEQAMVAR